MMEAILAHPLPVFALLALIFILHLRGARARSAQEKGRWAAAGFVAHLVLIIFFVFITFYLK